MIDQLPQPVVETSTTGVLLFANAAAREVFAIDSPNEGKRVRTLALVAPEDRRRVVGEFAYLCASLPQSQTQFTLLRKDGSKFPAIITARAMKSRGKIYGVRGVVADISSIRRTEERLRDSEQMLRLVLDLIPVAIFWKDRNFVYLGCNAVYAQRAGLSSPETLIGKTDADLPWREHAETAKTVESAILRTGVPQTGLEATLNSTRGPDRRVRLSKYPLRNARRNSRDAWIR